MARVTVFHTSDLHNKLTPEMAERLHDLKQAHPDSLMLDSGDAIWSGNIYWRPGGEPVLDLMNSVPYDAMCMGNREFHFMEVGLNAKTSRAAFPILSANLRTSNRNLSDEEALAVIARTGVAAFSRFHQDSGVVGVVGLSVPCITERMLSRNVSDFYFTDPVEAARDLAPLMRQCDVVIALTHIGIKRDIELAGQVPGFDIILGGHTHTITEEPERVGDTLIFHSGFYGHYVRKLEIEFGAGLPEVRSEMIPLGKA